MSIVLKVEGMVGRSIQNVADELVRVSRLLNMMVTSDFNGFHLMAVPTTSAQRLVADYHQWLNQASGTTTTSTRQKREVTVQENTNNKDGIMIIHKNGQRFYFTDAEITEIGELVVDLSEELKVDLNKVAAMLRASLASLRQARDAVNSIDRRVYAECAMRALGWKL